MPATPNSEPTRVTAGDSLAWTKSLPDYPATGYVLKYALQRVGEALITLTATASGTAHAISVAAAASALWPAGPYVWKSYVESIAVTPERTTLERGQLSVLPSPLAALSSTHASRTLALIQSALESRIPNGLESTNIDGQELSRIPLESLLRMRDKYQQLVNNEALAARSALGLPARRTIGIRFVKP